MTEMSNKLAVTLQNKNAFKYYNVQNNNYTKQITL